MLWWVAAMLGCLGLSLAARAGYGPGRLTADASLNAAWGAAMARLIALSLLPWLATVAGWNAGSRWWPALWGLSGGIALSVATQHPGPAAIMAVVFGLSWPPRSRVTPNTE